MSDRPSLERAIAELHLTRAIKPYMRSRKFILVITIPQNADLGEWKDVIGELVQDTVADEWRDNMKRSDSRTDMVVTEACAVNGLESCSFGRLRTVILVTADMAETFIGHPSVTAADAVVRINELSIPYMQRAFYTAVGRRIDVDEATDLISMPAKWRRIVVRAGRNPRAIVAAFKRSQKADVTFEKPKEDVGPHLEGMHGYGEAQVWGLELARDIADYKNGKIAWKDVDSGLLLSGPPGCGKTTFAAALARTCDMNFVVGSYASWQACGHQGDMLKAMRAAFSEARRKAPSVLLIDEIDGFLDRESGTGTHNGDYMRGVVNGLLEELDGSTGRAGVVVIGSCNNPEIVDPALVRPGRLDRHIAIELPDDEARMVILKGYLASDHDLDMRPFRTKTKGMTGADLERLARDARRLARREGITVEYRHVNAFLPKKIERSADQLMRIATHEIGHAVVGAVLNFAPLDHVFIVPDYFHQAGDQVAGSAAFKIEDSTHQDQAHYADRICTTMAAMACEKMILGSHGDGVIHDLESATNMAAFALSSVGMGDTLTSYGHRDPKDLSQMRMYDPILNARVEALLQEQLARAADLLERHQDVVATLIAELVLRKRLPGAAVYAALEVEQPAQNFG